MADIDFTLSPRGSNAANRLTPEQKLIRIGRAFKVYKACMRRVLHHQNGIHLYAIGSPTFKRRAAFAQQWSRYAQAISAYIERLTAPAGGAE